MKILTLTTDLQKEGFKYFEKSMQKHGWDYEVLNPQVSNFGEQLPFIVDWMRQTKEKEFIYLDAWDTVAMAGVEEFKSKLPEGVLFYAGAEMGCWPDASLIDKFPDVWRYRYLCGGGWYARIPFLLAYIGKYPNTENMNDQHYLQTLYLKMLEDGQNVALDTNAEIFFNIMLERPEDINIELGTVYNSVMRNTPLFIHGNGKTPMERYWELI